MGIAFRPAHASPIIGPGMKGVQFLIRMRAIGDIGLGLACPGLGRTHDDLRSDGEQAFHRILASGFVTISLG